MYAFLVRIGLMIQMKLLNHIWEWRIIRINGKSNTKLPQMWSVEVGDVSDGKISHEILLGYRDTA